MPKLFGRIVSALLALEERAEALKKRPLAKWSVVFVVVVVGIVAVSSTDFVQAAPPADTGAGPGILDNMLLILSGFILALAQIMGQLVVLLLDIAAIPLMQYNGFGSSPVVAAGWAIVRDVVNMFFVVILIVIAFGTIFGSQRFQWKQQVPKLLVFAIIINFSKTLATIIIDFGQVIMLTFANAIRDIAGGNFIQLLGLGDILQVSRRASVINSSLTNADAQGPKAFDWLAASVMAFFMMIWVLGTMIVLTVILAWRIVMLWVLVTIAPLAWFAGGIQEVVKSNAYAEWWTQFKCYVAIGPVVTFFVWLTLAVAGSGSIAAAEGFQTTAAGQEVNVANNLIAAFEVSRMTSFIIGIAMLFAGFQAAQQICSIVPGISEAFNRRSESSYSVAGLLKGTQGALQYDGARGGRLALGGTRSALGGAAGVATGIAEQIPGVRLATAPGRAGLWRAAAGAAGSVVGGGALAGFAGRRADRLEAQVATEAKEAAGDLSTETRQTKKNVLSATLKRGKPMGRKQRQAAQARYVDMLKDEDLREELDQTGELEKLHEMFGEDAKETFKGDKSMSDTIKGFNKARPDITGKEDKIDSWEDVQKLDAAALADEKVQARLKTVQSNKRNKDGTYMSAYEAIKDGGLGKKKADVLINGPSELYRGLDADELLAVPLERMAEVVTPEMIAKQPELANIIHSQDPKVQAAFAKNKNRDSASAAMLTNFGVGVNASGAVAITDVARFGKGVSASPTLLNNLPPALFEDPQVASSVVNQESIFKAVTRYKKGSPEQRQVYEQGMIKNLMTALEAAQSSAGNSEDRNRLAKLQNYLASHTQQASTGSSEQAFVSQINSLVNQIGSIKNHIAQKGGGTTDGQRRALEQLSGRIVSLRVGMGKYRERQGATMSNATLEELETKIDEVLKR